MNKFNYDGFELICKSTQDDLLEYFSIEMPKLYGKDNVIATNDYVFAKGDIPVCLVSHLDTVHKKTPEIILNDEKKGMIWSPQGIGGDDRAGIYIIIYILNKIGDKKPSILFTTDEEIGCLGAKIAAKDLKSKISGINFLLEFDRKGEDDAVFYSCENPKFIEKIESFGFKKKWGSCSDICSLSSSWGMASVNLSCGYYNAHTTNEYVMTNQLLNTAEKALKILKSTVINTFFKYETKSYSRKSDYEDYNYNSNNYGDLDIYEMLSSKYGKENIDDPFWFNQG